MEIEQEIVEEIPPTNVPEEAFKLQEPQCFLAESRL